jgi:CRISPR/Cas system-associated exonuclease Cas4 (RecB family)
MRDMRIRFALVVCGALALLGASSARAQAGTQVASALPSAPIASVVLVDGKPIGAAEAWSAKPVGTYDVVIPMDQGMMIATLTIAETDGKLGATVTLLEDDHSIPMDVTVSGTNLQLTLKREHGPITMNLQHRGVRVSGNYVVGGMGGGTIEGVVRQ